MHAFRRHYGALTLFHLLFKPPQCRNFRTPNSAGGHPQSAKPCNLPQIAKRRQKHLAENPGAKIISLGIGDTTEPIPPFISKAMAEAAQGLGTLEGYSGCAPCTLDTLYPNFILNPRPQNPSVVRAVRT